MENTTTPTTTPTMTARRLWRVEYRPHDRADWRPARGAFSDPCAYAFAVWTEAADGRKATIAPALAPVLRHEWTPGDPVGYRKAKWRAVCAQVDLLNAAARREGMASEWRLWYRDRASR